MRRSSLALVALAALVLTACAATDSGGSAGTPVVNVNGTGSGVTGITVTGTGEVTGTPDTVEINLGVSVLEENVQAATSSAAEKANALIATLTDGGVDRRRHHDHRLLHLPRVRLLLEPAAAGRDTGSATRSG